MNKRVFNLLALFAIFLNYTSACLGQIVPERYGNNPSSVDWKQTQTPHFKLVFPLHKSSIADDLASRAERIYQEYKKKLGTAPPHKITIYYNDADEIISGIRAQNTDDNYSIWTGNPLTPPSFSGAYKRDKALRLEIAYAFQEAVKAFPIDYWYYVFSRPHRSPWSNGFISYLAFPRQSPFDVGETRYYEYLQDQHIEKTSPQKYYYSTKNGRSQIHYFQSLHQENPLKQMYSHREWLFGLIPYFDFDAAFEQAAGRPYNLFEQQWKKHIRLKNAKDKAAFHSKAEGAPLLKQDEKIAYHGAVINESGDRMAAVTQPTTGSFLQQLRIIPLQKNKAQGAGAVISEGYFQPEMDWSTDQKLAFTKRQYDSQKGDYFYRLYIWNAQNSTIKKITDQKNVQLPVFSPDGNRLVYLEKATSQNIIWLEDPQSSSRKSLYGFASPVVVTQIDYHPAGKRLLISYEDDDNYKAGVFDIPTKTFSPLAVQTDVPLKAHWNPAGKAIYFNKASHGVINIFKSGIAGTSLTGAVPVTAQFLGAELWDVTDDTLLLAKTGEQVSLYLAKPVGQKKVELANDDARQNGAFGGPPQKGAESAELPVHSYHPFSNIKWEPPFGVPYYVNSGDFGFAGYVSLLEPMRTHQFDFTGILSLADPWDKSFFYSSYVNNSFKPRIELDFNHFPSAASFFGTSRKIETSDVVALTSLWKLSEHAQDFTSWYAGITLRHLAFNYFPESTLLTHHATVYLKNHYTRQTDLRVALIRRNLKPSRNTFIHPLQGNGARLSITASDKILGSQSRYARFRLDGYTILPGIGKDRIFLYGNGAVDVGEPAGADYLAFSTTGNYMLPDPDFMGSINPGLKQFVRGYKEPLLGSRFLFGKLEYRIPFLFETTKKFLGIIPPARTSFTFFVDGGVMGDALVTANQEKTIYRYSTGAEIKHVFGFGRNFKVTAELGLGQPLNKELGPNLYVNLRSAIPF